MRRHRQTSPHASYPTRHPARPRSGVPAAERKTRQARGAIEVVRSTSVSIWTLVQSRPHRNKYMPGVTDCKYELTPQPARLALTDSAKSSSTCSDSPQPRQASVMLLPYSRFAGSSLPAVNFCAPALRWLSTITPNTLWEPLASCAPTLRATSICLSCCLLLFAWLQSTISAGGSLAASRSLQAAATLAAS